MGDRKPHSQCYFLYKDTTIDLKKEALGTRLGNLLAVAQSENKF